MDVVWTLKRRRVRAENIIVTFPRRSILVRFFFSLLLDIGFILSKNIVLKSVLLFCWSFHPFGTHLEPGGAGYGPMTLTISSSQSVSCVDVCVGVCNGVCDGVCDGVCVGVCAGVCVGVCDGVVLDG